MVLLNSLHLELFYRYLTFMHLFSTYLPIMFLPTCHEDYHVLNALWELLFQQIPREENSPYFGAGNESDWKGMEVVCRSVSVTV